MSRQKKQRERRKKQYDLRESIKRYNRERQDSRILQQRDEEKKNQERRK